MVNAVVSHELRNPLNALLGQIVQIQMVFEALQSLIAMLQANPSQVFAVNEVLPKLKSIYSSLKECICKIQQSAKFIDYFAHDILDYSILHKDSTRFRKQMQVFDIRKAVTEIMDLQNDKVTMKGITVDTLYEDFV